MLSCLTRPDQQEEGGYESVGDFTEARHRLGVDSKVRENRVGVGRVGRKVLGEPWGRGGGGTDGRKIFFDLLRQHIHGHLRGVKRSVIDF